MVYETTNWWSQIKTPGAAIYANRHYLKLYRQINSGRLAKVEENCNGNSSGKSEHVENIIGDVYIHSSANIHPSAVIGPNVSIGKNVNVGAGARIKVRIHLLKMLFEIFLLQNIIYIKMELCRST